MCGTLKLASDAIPRLQGKLDETIWNLERRAAALSDATDRMLVNVCPLDHYVIKYHSQKALYCIRCRRNSSQDAARGESVFYIFSRHRWSRKAGNSEDRSFKPTIEPAALTEEVFFFSRRSSSPLISIIHHLSSLSSFFPRAIREGASLSPGELPGRKQEHRPGCCRFATDIVNYNTGAIIKTDHREMDGISHSGKFGDSVTL